MILTQCTNETKPADFELLAQNPITYELLGFSATGSEYAGDFSGYQCRIGTSNELGDYSGELGETYTPPTNASVAAKFNAWQDEKRRDEYAARNGLDDMISEAYRKSVHPRYNASQRGQANQRVIDEFERVEAKFPKV